MFKSTLSAATTEEKAQNTRSYTKPQILLVDGMKVTLIKNTVGCCVIKCLSMTLPPGC